MDLSSSSSEDDEVAPRLINAADVVARVQQRFQSSHVEQNRLASQNTTCDVGNLAMFSYNAIDQSSYESGARDAAQLLIGALFDLPAQVTDTQVLVSLPQGDTVLPREKPMPIVDKDPTRWDKFAERKGIRKKPKRSRRAWDESTESFRPRYGKGSKAHDDARPWLVELKGGSDDVDTAMSANRKSRKEQISKQERQKQRNLERARVESTRQKIPGNTTVPSFRGLSKADKVKVKARLKTQMDVTRKGTASLGRFDKQLKGEPKRKNGKRTGRIPTSFGSEKDQSMKIVDRLLNSERDNPMNLQKAINRHINQPAKPKKKKGKWR